MSATLKVYPDKLNTEVFEEIQLTPGTTFEQYLLNNVPGYSPDNLLFSVKLNGHDFPPILWGSHLIDANDQLIATVEAKDPLTVVMVIVAVVAAAAAIYAMNQIPDNYNETTPDGSSIYKVNAQGNRPRLMGIIPEVLGRHKVFPDLLNQPHYEYINNDQYLSLFMSVGVGQYQINDDEIYIGDTPINRYSGDYELTIFEPGTDVTSHAAHRNIYTSKEVSDIELEGAETSTTSADSRIRWTFSGTTLTKYFLQGYQSGNVYPVITAFPYQVGDIVTIDSVGEPNDGDFKVVSISNNVATMQRVDGNGDDDTTWTTFTEQLHVLASVQVQGAVGAHSGPYFACPSKEKTNTLFLDFSLPQGLGELDNDGDFLSRTVDIEIQYRDESAPTWTTVNHSFTNATNDQLAETLTINLGSLIRPEVRVKRVTPTVDDTKIYDMVQWTGLKAELNSASSYIDVTTIGIKIKGTNTLSQNAQNKFNLIATRKLPVWNEQSQTWSAPQVTQDIAPAFAHVIKDVGHTDAQLELSALDALHTTWQNRGDTFNAIFDSPSTLFDVLKRILAVGYAEPTLDYGQIIPIRDEPRIMYEQMYQPQNMLKGGLSQDIKLIDEDEPDGVEIEYFSETTWKSETVMCLLDGDLAIKPERIRAFGITDHDKAWQFGMRKRRAKRYRRTMYNFKTEMDALNSGYLSYCALADDIPGYSQTGSLVDVQGNTLLLDQPLDWETGTHFIAVRKPDGSLSGVYTATKGIDDYQVVIDQPLDFTPNFDGLMEPPFFMFGKAERWSYPVLITDINPSGTDSVSVKAVNYDERIYADDDNLAPV